MSLYLQTILVLSLLAFKLEVAVASTLGLAFTLEVASTLGLELELAVALILESFSFSFPCKSFILFILSSSWAIDLVVSALFINFRTRFISLVIRFFSLSRFLPFVSSFNFSVKDCNCSFFSFSFCNKVAFNSLFFSICVSSCLIPSSIDFSPDILLTSSIVSGNILLALPPPPIYIFIVFLFR